MTLFKKVIFYCLGLFLLAMGVTFSIKSDLGVSPINSIPYVLSLFTSIEQGIWIIIFFSFFILVQIVLLRKEFRPVNLFQLAFAIAFGYFVTLSNFIFSFEAPTHYVLRLILLAISILLIACGVLLYLRVNLIPMPAEGCMLAIVKKTGITFSKVKSYFDTSVVVLAGLLAIIFLGKLTGIREGTVLAAILVGKLVGILNQIFKTQLIAFDYFINSNNNKAD
jgi:uncharacterized membrane protein YczE